MQCPACRAAVEGRYCNKCGASLGAASAPAHALPDHVASALSYVLGAITGVLFLTLEPYSRNPDVRFHAWQSTLFSLFVFLILAAGPLMATFLPWALIAVVGFLELGLVFAMLIAWLALMYKAYAGERWVLPVIGSVALRKA